MQPMLQTQTEARPEAWAPSTCPSAGRPTRNAGPQGYGPPGGYGPPPGGGGYGPPPGGGFGAPPPGYGAPPGGPPPGGFGGPPMGPPGMPGMFPGQRNSGLAIASMVCGILAIVPGCCCGLFGLPLSIAALVMGGIAMSQIKNSAGQLKGGGFAIAGLSCGGVAIALDIAAVFLNVAQQVSNSV